MAYFSQSLRHPLDKGDVLKLFLIEFNTCHISLSGKHFGCLLSNMSPRIWHLHDSWSLRRLGEASKPGSAWGPASREQDSPPHCKGPHWTPSERPGKNQKKKSEKNEKIQPHWAFSGDSKNSWMCLDALLIVVYFSQHGFLAVLKWSKEVGLWMVLRTEGQLLRLNSEKRSKCPTGWQSHWLAMASNQN